MAINNSQRQAATTGANGPKFRRTLFDDLHRGDLKRTLRRDLRDLYQFYLDEETRVRLTSMGRFKRSIFLMIWLLKSLFLKLTPVRRLLLLVSLVLSAPGEYSYRFGDLEVRLDLHFVGFAILLVVLMLELKDKLLAREELEVGRSVQSALMPDKNPNIPGWEIWMYTRPAKEVGGDMVDYLKFSEERLAVAVGDVAGKGLGAALLMAKLQSTLRALAPDSGSLAELGSRMNAIFCRDGLPSRFATLIYLELRADAGLVRILNAGHLPPISLQSSTLHKLERVAPALGIIPVATYAEQHIELHVGDLLLVYSDGLTEARNEKGEFFGDQRLLELLLDMKGSSAEAAGAGLVAAVDRFVGEARPNDDLSLILLRRST